TTTAPPLNDHPSWLAKIASSSRRRLPFHPAPCPASAALANLWDAHPLRSPPIARPSPDTWPRAPLPKTPARGHKSPAVRSPPRRPGRLRCPCRRLGPPQHRVPCLLRFHLRSRSH